MKEKYFERVPFLRRTVLILTRTLFSVFPEIEP